MPGPAAIPIAVGAEKAIELGLALAGGLAAQQALKTVQFPGGRQIDAPSGGVIPQNQTQLPLEELAGVSNIITNPSVGIQALTQLLGGAATPAVTPPPTATNQEQQQSVLNIDGEPIPTTDEFGNPVAKFNFHLDTGKIEPVSQSHFITAPRGTKSGNLIRGFINAEQKAFGTRTIEPDDAFLPTAEELAEIRAKSFEVEFEFAERAFRSNPDLQFFVPNMHNTDVGISETLNLENIPKERILTREQVLGKSEK